MYVKNMLFWKREIGPLLNLSAMLQNDRHSSNWIANSGFFSWFRIWTVSLRNGTGQSAIVERKNLWVDFQGLYSSMHYIAIYRFKTQDTSCHYLPWYGYWNIFFLFFSKKLFNCTRDSTSYFINYFHFSISIILI